MERNVNSRGCVWDHGCALECIHPLILCGEIVSAPKYKRTPRDVFEAKRNEAVSLYRAVSGRRHKRGTIRNDIASKTLLHLGG